MKKTLAAVVGLLLVAGQAVAAGQTSTARVADRVGPRVSSSDEFVGRIPIIGILAAIGVLAAAIEVAAGGDDSESD